MLKQLIYSSRETQIRGRAESMFYEEARQLQMLGKPPQIPALIAFSGTPFHKCPKPTSISEQMMPPSKGAIVRSSASPGMKLKNSANAYLGKPDINYRLPSKAEWEYVCRAGSTSPFTYGNTITASVANYDANTTYGSEVKGEFRKRTADVGEFYANRWGLHDMHENVMEWCNDHWHDNYEGAPEDGSAWVTKGLSGVEGRVLV